MWCLHCFIHSNSDTLATREEEACKKEEEIWRMEQEVKRKEEAATRRVEEAKKTEEVAKEKEAEAMRKEEDAKKKEEELRQKVEEARQKTEELERKEEEAKQREAQLEQDIEKTKQMQLETQKVVEDLKKMEEKAIRKDIELKEREDILRRREQELMRREAENFPREEEAKKKQEEVLEEVRRREELKEKARKDEEAKQEARGREEETRKEKPRQEGEEDNMKLKLEAEEKRKADETAKRREEDSRRREEAKLEGFRREQEEKRLQDESQHLEDLFRDLDPSRVDSDLMNEQIILLQEAKYRKRVEDIRRAREERKTNDSVSNDSGWPNPSESHLSNSPGTPPSWGAEPPPSIKSTASASSTTSTGRSSFSTSTGKPWTGSVGPGTYPTSSSPHTASFTDAERTRKQREFAESQHEQFRRAQEKWEAERQLKSAGRPLSREELQRVFEHHEKLWTRLNILNELSWNDFPWPMAKPPSNPDDMTLPQISAYIQSPLYPDKDKTRTPKDRIKELIKRWHPDRFETKLLPKVVEDEKEKVKHGAGNVARYLSDLLRKENESNNKNNIFGD